jgi:hypothetical protein
MSIEEVLGPGRHPLAEPADKSVGAALAFTLLFGPLGLSYVSVVGGMICTVLAVLAVVLYGFAALLIAWPITMVCAGIIASGMHRAYERS